MEVTERSVFAMTMQEQDVGNQTSVTSELESYPVMFRAVLGAVLALETVGGLACNLLVLVVFHLHKRRSSAHVGSVFITNQSVVDVVLTLTTLPLTLTLVVAPSRAQVALLCYLHEASISFASSASAVNLLVISFHRYETIVTPFKTRLLDKHRKRTLCAVWVLSCLGFASPFLALIPTMNSEEVGGSPTDLSRVPCFVWLESGSGIRIYYELYYVVLYLICNTVMIICYYRIFRVGKNRAAVRLAMFKTLMIGTALPRERLPEPNQSQKSNEKTLTKMTLTIVASFMVCWGPHTATSLAIVVRGTTVELEMVQLGCLTLAYSTTVIHPLVYAFLRKNFRQAVSDSLQRQTSKKHVRVSPELRASPGLLHVGFTSKDADCVPGPSQSGSAERSIIPPLQSDHKC